MGGDKRGQRRFRGLFKGSQIRALNNMHKIFSLTIISVLILLAQSVFANDLSTSSIKIKGNSYQISIPNGYKLEFINAKLSRPRLITFGKNGDLFIGSRSGYLYHLKPPYNKIHHQLDFGGYPHSIAFRYHDKNTEVFVAESEGLYLANYNNDGFILARDDFSLVAPLPGGSSHSSRTVAVGPDQRVYVGLGISGNCSNEYLDSSYDFNHRRGGVFILDESTTTPQLVPFASGLRNPIGFDWQPDSHELYASNNGPDHLGYEEPREYFSKLRANSFHGMPWFQLIEGKIERDDCIKHKPPQPKNKVVLPAATFDARSAPMAVAFIDKNALDAHYSGDAIVALHGSWGTKPSGGFSGNPASRRHPKLVRVDFKDDEAIAVKDFITGFQLENGSRWARPMGVASGPDGALYFTSDTNNEGPYRLSKN
ncbi:MAG: sugar dehydrogenase [Gammaproteobacteria bacterium]|nr:MAG: sugar dehydrogenase [Gammaproteobacteria bacterium]